MCMLTPINFVCLQLGCPKWEGAKEWSVFRMKPQSLWSWESNPELFDPCLMNKPECGMGWTDRALPNWTETGVRIKMKKEKGEWGKREEYCMDHKAATALYTCLPQGSTEHITTNTITVRPHGVYLRHNIHISCLSNPCHYYYYPRL